MGWKIWQQGSQKLTAAETFHLLTATLLGLLLPLSFLLLSRFSAARYLLSLAPHRLHNPLSLTVYLFLHANPTLLHALVSVITAAALIHGLTGRITPAGGPQKPIFRPHLSAAWILLCALQICVGFGIEGSVALGIEGSGFGKKRSFFGRLVLFVGLHETMLYWWRTVVKPVVDDTVLGSVKEERWVERTALAACFGTLWWGRLREELESLVAILDVKKEMSMEIGIADFVGWWLYYVTVTIGMVRIVKGIMWIGVVVLCRRVEAIPDEENRGDDEEKV
ncbi:hypothetical protein NMG60_11035109 [Bertholletia excelsa]